MTLAHDHFPSERCLEHLGYTPLDPNAGRKRFTAEWWGQAITHARELRPKLTKH